MAANFRVSQACLACAIGRGGGPNAERVSVNAAEPPMCAPQKQKARPIWRIALLTLAGGIVAGLGQRPGLFGDLVLEVLQIQRNLLGEVRVIAQRDHVRIVGAAILVLMQIASEEPDSA